MQTIVVIGVPKRDAEPSAEQASVGSINDRSQESIDGGARRTNRSSTSSERDEVTPPFWTWFIENPRGRMAG